MYDEYEANGNGGQLVMVVPELQLVVGVMAGRLQSLSRVAAVPPGAAPGYRREPHDLTCDTEAMTATSLRGRAAGLLRHAVQAGPPDGKLRGRRGAGEDEQNATVAAEPHHQSVPRRRIHH